MHDERNESRKQASNDRQGIIGHSNQADSPEMIMLMHDSSLDPIYQSTGYSSMPHDSQLGIQTIHTTPGQGNYGETEPNSSQMITSEIPVQIPLDDNQRNGALRADIPRQPRNYHHHNDPVLSHQNNDVYDQTVQMIMNFFDNKVTPSMVFNAIHQSAGDVRTALSHLAKNYYRPEDPNDFSYRKVRADKEKIYQYFSY